MFSEKVNNAPKGYTFDDFLLVPNASWVEAKNVNTKIQLSKKIKLNIPVLSAAMDTVSESAIALAQEGGIGVIHRNMTSEMEVEEVKKVKSAEEITIRDVVTITPDSDITTVQDIMENESISGLPVIEDDKIVGIISKRDVKPMIRSGVNKKVNEIMTSDVVTIEETSHNTRYFKS